MELHDRPLANGTHSFTATDVIASEVSVASAALAVTLSAAATTPARNYRGHGWARGSHAPIGKFIDKATLDDIFGTSSTTASHHAGDLSASDPTVNATTEPSENLGSASHRDLHAYRHLPRCNGYEFRRYVEPKQRAGHGGQREPCHRCSRWFTKPALD